MGKHAVLFFSTYWRLSSPVSRRFTLASPVSLPYHTLVAYHTHDLESLLLEYSEDSEPTVWDWGQAEDRGPEGGDG